MEKIDLRKELQSLYAPSAKEVALVEVPTQQYLMVDGQGDPNTSAAFAAAAEVLFSLSYCLKFLVKKGPPAVDYRVMPLEGLWSAEDMASFSTSNKEAWLWTIMIMQPKWVDEALVERARAEVGRKKPRMDLGAVRFEPMSEGLCAQILHIGPFAEEGPAVARLHAHIAAIGREPGGRHHEIYLSDIRRADPAKWKTILRQPLR